jgi:hypothetical protein
MSVVINASTTSGLVMTSDLSGSLQFQNNGVNLPMSGVAPAFAVYSTNSQSVNDNTTAKVQLNVERFDTNNNFDNATNYRFTPTVAGYYQVNGHIAFSGTATGYARAMIFKNGSSYAEGSSSPNNSITGAESTASSVIYLNGSTDYVELYCYLYTGVGALTLQNSSPVNYFNGCLVRGA